MYHGVYTVYNQYEQIHTDMFYGMYMLGCTCEECILLLAFRGHRQTLIRLKRRLICQDIQSKYPK